MTDKTDVQVPSDLTQERISQLIQAVQSLYTSKVPVTQKSVIAQEYSSTATFEDPFVLVNGRDNIYAQFRSLAGFFASVEHKLSAAHTFVESTLPTETANVNAESITITPIIKFDNVQSYRTSLTSNPVTLETTTVLSLKKEDGKWVIHRHSDRWANIKLFDRIPGYQWLGRPFVGTVTSFAFKLMFRG
ncbi:hypothetical protein HK102_005118 [Quaeritorhiza haematococci]|nr:hypothetical protein HK102_005118 [Quaeritorhiza haematococci]